MVTRYTSRFGIIFPTGCNSTEQIASVEREDVIMHQEARCRTKTNYIRKHKYTGTMCDRS